MLVAVIVGLSLLCVLILVIGEALSSERRRVTRPEEGAGEHS
jgi:hypothetical protein